MRIERLELRLVELPLVRSFETSFGRLDRKQFILVRIEGDGAAGYGECVADREPLYSSETNGTAWHVITEFIAPRLINLPLAHPGEIGPALRAIRGHAMAKAAVEMAAWDLYARLRREPLCRALSCSARSRIEAGVSIGIHGSFDELAAAIERELAAGYRRIKVKIKPGWDVDVVSKIRKRFGSIPLMVDANGAYTLTDREHLARLDDVGLMMIEQPLEHDDIYDHAALQRRITTPICLDESVNSVRAADQAISAGACRIVNIKPGRLGGFGESVRVHDLCAGRGVPVWHGGMLESGIGRAANVHLASLPNFSLPGDIAASRRYFDPDLVDPPIEVAADGTIAVPSEPGLGVAVVEDRVERATVRRTVLHARSTVALMVAMLAIAAVALVAAASAGCAKAPPPPAPAGPTFEQKMAWILRLEDERLLREPVPVAPPAPEQPRRGRQTPVVVSPPPPPDLIGLLGDSEPRVRRRAALAVGRVGLREGVQPLLRLLSDGDPEVRQMSAFALGLIGDRGARDALIAALGDGTPAVQGSAAEALGLLGAGEASAPIARMIAAHSQSVGAEPAPETDADGSRRDTPSAAVRLGLFALTRLKAYDQLASVVLDGSGQPRLRTWAAAYALQAFADARSLPALLTLAKESNLYTRVFAIKGLAALKDRRAIPVLVPLLSSGDRAVLIETIRALGRIGDPETASPILRMAQASDTDPLVRLEAVSALGGFTSVGAQGLTDMLLDSLADPAPSIRAAALRSLAAMDSAQFVTVLSALDPDSQWSVRAALATVLGTLAPHAGLPRLTAMLADADQRVIPSVLRSLVKLNAPGIAQVLLERLRAEDPVVRAAAATGLGELRPPGGAQALADAYRSAARDPTYVARGAALSALARYGPSDAVPVLRSALADRDWSIRVRAASLLKELDPSIDADLEIRPAPTTLAPAVYQSARLVRPDISPQVYVETDRGTFQVELTVLDAPLTADNFAALARKGFFDGLIIHRVEPNFVVQDGDPRGDGEGGPGYTIRDELNERPYLRGTVGMALDWADTGGSQFFVTVLPQPRLDAKYTVFGRVVSGMEVVDRIQAGDVIRHIRLWDGQQMTPR